MGVYSTPHDKPPAFEVRLGKIEQVKDLTFNFYVPMRKGWMKVAEGISLESALQEAQDGITG